MLSAQAIFIGFGPTVQQYFWHRLQLWQVSWLSTPTPEVSNPTPTPELELTPTPTPTTAPFIKYQNLWQVWSWAQQVIEYALNTLRPRQNGRHFADVIFKCIFMNENVRISINISLKCVPKNLINNIPALVQIMAWRRPGDKPLSEPMMVNLLTHICVTQPQWVNDPNWDLTSSVISEGVFK